MSESEKYQIHVLTRSYALVNYFVLFVELAPPAVISDYGHVSNMTCFDFVCDAIVLLK